ncbi:MAG: methylenetetrahydrofolate reductase [SAR324 cluster bacterium]|nr:methylenetetrahydrofolate reductase [SAR324 cluster bacterium]
MKKKSKISFSLEVFPAKTKQAQIRFWQSISELKTLSPAYFSVTSSGESQANGSTKELTLKIKRNTNIEAVAHIVSINQTVNSLRELARDYYASGIKRVVALRGDLENGDFSGQEIKDAAQVVKILKQEGDFDISVAGYPEKHPKATSLAADIENLKMKVDQGANRVITQFFFDPDVFLRFRDKAYLAGIRVEIVPGLLPILNFDKLLIFARRCQANVPNFLHEMFADMSHQSLHHNLLAMNVLSHQVTRLIDNGVNHFHFYTLNSTSLTFQICRWINIAF